MYFFLYLILILFIIKRNVLNFIDYIYIFLQSPYLMSLLDFVIIYNYIIYFL